MENKYGNAGDCWLEARAIMKQSLRSSVTAGIAGVATLMGKTSSNRQRCAAEGVNVEYICRDNNNQKNT